MHSKYDPKGLNWLAALAGTPPDNPLQGLLRSLPPPSSQNNALAALADALTPRPRVKDLNLFDSLVPSTRPATSVDSLLRAIAPSPPNLLDGLVARPAPTPLAAPTKRKAFFSFHFDDIMRVNVVRNAWKITHPDNALMRSFCDSSLWERRKLEGDASIKRLIRDGICYTSAVCVLVGSDTWWRRWVRYEIARAVIDSRGLLAVHLNGIRHHQTKAPHILGANPLEFMAVGKFQADVWSPTRYYLFEKIHVPSISGDSQWSWVRYKEHTDPVKLPVWLDDPTPGRVMPLSCCAQEYDYTVNEGHKNIGEWIDQAARAVGR
jgi:MTH538 TIR-like domain (DUF1863)